VGKHVETNILGNVHYSSNSFSLAKSSFVSNLNANKVLTKDKSEGNKNKEKLFLSALLVLRRRSAIC